MRRLLSIVSACILLCACSKVPGHIIQPEEMAQLMADVNTGEAVVEMNRASYNNDSLKQILKQSIYSRHGVTTEEVDSSLAWYGRNITCYMDVCDRTIEILEQRLIESGNRVSAEAALSVAGDSVDVWTGPRYVSVYDRMPSKDLVFSFNRDENWERGDSYTWRAKFFNQSEKAKWQLVAEYADGTIEFIRQTVEGPGWHELTLITDSLLDATRVYGNLSIENRPGTAVRLDSVAMLRKRLESELYGRRYLNRRVGKILDPVEISDSTAASATPDSVPDGKTR